MPAQVRSPADSVHPPPRPFLPEVALRGIGIHALTEKEAVSFMLDELDSGRGGFVVTPNLDHLRRVLREPAFGGLYAQADLRLADGQVIVWACRLQRTPIPERVAGSNLISSLSAAAARRGRSIFLLGGNAGTAEKAAAVLQGRSPGLRVAGTECPPMGFELDPLYVAKLAMKLRESQADIVFVGLGSPKQEYVCRQMQGELPAAWWLGVGVSFSFLCGEVERAPLWVQRAGLEWFHRFAQEPGRLFKRYFVHGLPFAAYLLGRTAIRGILPKGRRASRYGHSKPRCLIVDDDSFALDHLELLLSGRFPELEIEKRAHPSIDGTFDFYFLDNDFRGERLAGKLASEVRRLDRDALVFAFSGLLDVGTLKRLINAGCDGACDKADPGSWKPVLAIMEERLRSKAERHARETSAFGGVRHAAGSISHLLRDWNRRGNAELGPAGAAVRDGAGEGAEVRR